MIIGDDCMVLVATFLSTHDVVQFRIATRNTLKNELRNRIPQKMFYNCSECNKLLWHNPIPGGLCTSCVRKYRIYCADCGIELIDYFEINCSMTTSRLIVPRMCWDGTFLFSSNDINLLKPRPNCIIRCRGICRGSNCRYCSLPFVECKCVKNIDVFAFYTHNSKIKYHSVYKRISGKPVSKGYNFPTRRCNLRVFE